ncbi:hydroxyisourate hydrolase [Pseudonocardia dioxanivorans]|uniref:5-hydroxyisourate hydrolase n=1 Tax=Pseudonocardia dioxanivorans (strain ATCC 55486 / DSM 44775 / JCM 13855 / CB1190) TaxID=675635 RepID=F4CML8_PSEUX|nr:hydroxyisourate hydrolase [Pseudonocardia dioxanivorans]AEA24002.1 hydroxyisourate hydrolase [Pseudonocardia dioxanivorans CB1190]
MSLSTHVLDAATGSPAAGMRVSLEGVGSAVTDDDGRARFADLPAPGTWRLVFDTGAWFGDRPHFHPEVVVTFTVTDPAAHLHVPLLLSPFAYSTYRGS